MAYYFLETSALVKLYVREQGTGTIPRLVRSCSPRQMSVLALSRVEFRAAVRRRQRSGDIDARLAGSLLTRFERHWATEYLIQPLTETVLADAAFLIDRHPLRAYDAVQLAGCLVFRETDRQEPVIFVSPDRNLLEAAEREGLPVLDPTSPDPAGNSAH